MEGKVLLAWSSKHGSTYEVAVEIEKALRQPGLEIELREAAEVKTLAEYDAVVLGAPIYMGRWNRDAQRFLRRHAAELAVKPLAVFALGPLHDDEEEWTKARGVVAAVLEERSLKPVSVELFGGRIDPGELRFPFSKMPAGDARDWQEIERWAAGLPALLAPAVPV